MEASRLTESIWNIQATLQHTHWMAQEQGVPREEKVEQRKVLYQQPGRTTEFDQQIQDVMAMVESVLGRHLRERFNLSPQG